MVTGERIKPPQLYHGKSMNLCFSSMAVRREMLWTVRVTIAEKMVPHFIMPNSYIPSSSGIGTGRLTPYLLHEREKMRKGKIDHAVFRINHVIVLKTLQYLLSHIWKEWSVILDLGVCIYCKSTTQNCNYFFSNSPCTAFSYNLFSYNIISILFLICVTM